MGMSRMMVRFPDGSVKFGSYQNTADIGSPWLGDTPEEAELLYRRSHGESAMLPTEGDLVEVELYIPYGGGTHGKMDARGGHLTEHAYYVYQCGGWGVDLPPTMRDIQKGEPNWVREFYEVDWVEDFSHDNGNYQCICATCDRAFVGHKRRVTCKACSKRKPNHD